MIRSLAVAALTTIMLTGCSFAFSHGPPRGHEGMSEFQCTESVAAPTLDAVGGVLYGIETLMFAMIGSAYTVQAGVVTAAFAFSAHKGFGDSSDCRHALEQLRIRQMRDSLVRTMRPQAP